MPQVRDFCRRKGGIRQDSGKEDVESGRGVMDHASGRAKDDGFSQSGINEHGSWKNGVPYREIMIPSLAIDGIPPYFSNWVFSRSKS